MHTYVHLQLGETIDKHLQLGDAMSTHLQLGHLMTVVLLLQFGLEKLNGMFHLVLNVMHLSVKQHQHVIEYSGYVQCQGKNVTYLHTIGPKVHQPV